MFVVLFKFSPHKRVEVIGAEVGFGQLGKVFFVIGFGVVLGEVTFDVQDIVE